MRKGSVPDPDSDTNWGQDSDTIGANFRILIRIQDNAFGSTTLVVTVVFIEAITMRLTLLLYNIIFIA